MRKSSNFVSAILIFVIIVLVGVVGGLGYTIYKEIMGEGYLEVSFEGEAGFPVIEYKTSSKNEKEIIDNSIFNGVDGEGNSNGVQPTLNKHLYNQLDTTAKTIYSKLYNSKEKLKTGTYTIEFGNEFSELLSQENGDIELQKQYQSAIEALIYENPDLFYIDATKMYINIEKITRITGVKYNVYINNGSKTSYLTDGFYTKDDVDTAILQVETMKAKILIRTNGKSDYEKAKIVHDYLIDSIEYDTTILEDNIYNIYGALVSKKCVCEGYAKAYQYLMNELGIENVIVIGTGTNSSNETENHAWNYIKLDNKWYAVDVTWDDPIIIGGGALMQKSRYQHFLNGSKSFFKNHVASGKFTQGGQIFEYPTLSLYDYQ